VFIACLPTGILTSSASVGSKTWTALQKTLAVSYSQSAYMCLQFIGFADSRKIGNIQCESIVSAAMLSNFFAIDIDCRAVIDSFEIEHQALTGPFARHGEVSRVPGVKRMINQDTFCLLECPSRGTVHSPDRPLSRQEGTSTSLSYVSVLGLGSLAFRGLSSRASRHLQMPFRPCQSERSSCGRGYDAHLSLWSQVHLVANGTYLTL
jgi:hypothetical protein